MGEKETMTSADANLADDGNPAAASRSITDVEDPGFDGGPHPAEGKAIVTPVDHPTGLGGEQAASPLYSELANAGVMPSI